MKHLSSKTAPCLSAALVLGIFLARCDNWPAPRPTGGGDGGCTPGEDECASDADCDSPFLHCDTDTCTCVPFTLRACAANSDNCDSNDDCYNGVCDRPGCNCTCHACGEHCPCAGKAHGDACTTPGSGVSGTCNGCKCVIPACAGDDLAACSSDEDCQFGHCDPDTCTCYCGYDPGSPTHSGSACHQKDPGDSCNWRSEPGLPYFHGTCNEHCRCCECDSDADCDPFEYCDPNNCLCRPRSTCAQCDDCDQSACAACAPDEDCYEAGEGTCTCVGPNMLYGCLGDEQCGLENYPYGRKPGDTCRVQGSIEGVCDETCDCVVASCPYGGQLGTCQTKTDGDACVGIGSVGDTPGVCHDCICVCPEGNACEGKTNGNSCEFAPGITGECVECECERVCPAGSYGCWTDADCGSPLLQCNESCNCVGYTLHACSAFSDGCGSDADCEYPPCDVNTCNCFCPDGSDGCTTWSDCMDPYSPSSNPQYCEIQTCNCVACPEGATGCTLGSCPSGTYCGGCYCVPEYEPQPAALFTCPEDAECETEYFEVYYCQKAGGGLYEWYEVVVTYIDGQPVSETIVGGPHTGEWRAGCPGKEHDGGGGGKDKDGGGGCGGATSC